MKKNLILIFVCFLFLFFNCNKNAEKYPFNLLPFQYQENAKWGYVDLSGQEVIPPKFDKRPSYFKENYALIEKDGVYDYINMKGDTLGYKFTSATLFSEGLAFVMRPNGLRYAIDQSFNNKFCIDSIGTQISLYGSFSEGMAKFSNDKAKWGFFNTEGKVVIEAKYEQVYSFKDGLAYVEEKDATNKKLIKKFIDNSGKEKFRIKDSITSIRSFSEGLAAFQDTIGWGFIDAEGKIAIPSNKNWKSVTNFNNDYASFLEFGEWGVMDKKGNRVLGSNYKNPLIFFNDMAVKQNENGNVFIDSKGDKKISSDYTEVLCPFLTNCAIVKDGKYYIFITEEGKQKTDKEYFSIDPSGVKELYNNILGFGYTDVLIKTRPEYFRGISIDGTNSYRGNYPLDKETALKTTCYHFVNNEAGKLVSIEYLINGILSQNTDGYAKIMFAYENGFETRTYKNTNDEIAENAEKVSTEKLELDKNNRCIAVNNLDKKGTLINDDYGIARYVWNIDAQGNRIIEKRYDKNNQLVTRNNIYSIGYKYDNKNNKTETKFLNEAGESVESSDGIALYRFKYDAQNNLIERANYNKNNELLSSDKSVAIYRYQYDGIGRIIKIEFYDKDNKKAVYPNTKIAAISYTYSDSGAPQLKYYDIDGKESNL
jgi:hypothetical protein